MEIVIEECRVIVTGSEQFRTESSFWYALKNKLKAMGYDVIKKLMVKDAHLVSENVYYIRERKWQWCIWDGEYAIRSLNEYFNETGSVVLSKESL